MISHLPTGHPPVAFGRVGVLLVNLGTPDATDYWSMRRYLKQFLSDPRVIETNRALWWVILNGIILTIRPKRSAHAYEQIWNHEKNESPLRTITRAQADDLAQRFASAGVLVDWAMRYGQPAIADRIRALKDQGCERILLVPLYPQYCAATSATVVDDANDCLKTLRWQPAMRTLPPYYDHPLYIEALAQGLEAHLATLSWQPDLVLASYHGLPQSYFDKGDPYHCHCAKTTRLLAARLGWPGDRLRMVFQSRFGRTQWLQPYALPTIEALPAAGIKKIAVIMPGFAADCVETLEEVAIGLKETFMAKGGEQFTTVPCLNDSVPSQIMLEGLITQELGGWLRPAPGQGQTHQAGARL